MVRPLPAARSGDRADHRRARGTLKVGKVNVDEQPQLAERAGVQDIPLIVVYRDGKPVAQAVGAHPKSALERELNLDTDVMATAQSG